MICSIGDKVSRTPVAYSHGPYTTPSRGEADALGLRNAWQDQFGCVFGEAIQGDRCRAEGILIHDRDRCSGRAVDRTGTGIDEALYAALCSRQQRVDGALDIDGNDGSRVRGLPPCAGGDHGAVDHRVDRPHCQGTRQVGIRQDGAADQGEFAGQAGKVPVGAPRERYAVEPDHLAACGQQVLHDVESDEAGGAGDEDCHAWITAVGRRPRKSALLLWNVEWCHGRVVVD
jgi:hypothetical protein